MAIEFDCTSCGKRLRVQDQDAGKKAECPECRTILEIPAAPIPSEPPVESTIETPAPSEDAIGTPGPYPPAGEAIDPT
ncbi:MAG: hypothetical protein ACC645_17170, partial [Pirellulales bacterium]